MRARAAVVVRVWGRRASSILPPAAFAAAPRLPHRKTNFIRLQTDAANLRILTLHTRTHTYDEAPFLFPPCPPAFCAFFSRLALPVFESAHPPQPNTNPYLSLSYRARARVCAPPAPDTLFPPRPNPCKDNVR